MKKLLLLPLMAIMRAGCGPKYVPRRLPLVGYNLTVIDSCEYIYSANTMAHKGNCRFCKERKQKELEELVIKLKEK